MIPFIATTPANFEPICTPIEVLQNVWWLGVVSLLVSLVATPLVRHLAYRFRIVDKPDDLLKPHGRPVAYLGGVAMCAGLLAGLIVYTVTMDGAAQHWSQLKESFASMQISSLLGNRIWNLTFIMLSAVLITIVGLVDDIKGISPKQKVLGQVIAALLLLVGGIGGKMATVILSLLFNEAWPVWLVFPLSSIMCVMIVVATCNATNLLDGLDGLCGGVTGIIALGFLGLAVYLATYGRFQGGDELRVVYCLAMAGAVLGFLPYNLPPASIFMGDAGSMLLGFFVATMMALFCMEGNARWFLASWVVFALPTLDTALAVVRRLLAGKSIFAGDRSHLYDQLVDRGWSVKRVVRWFYFLAAVAAFVGVIVSVSLRLRYAVPVYAIGFVGVWVVFHKLGMIRPPKDAQADDHETNNTANQDVDRLRI